MPLIRTLWASVRPRTRRGAVLGVIGVLAGSAAVSVALFGAAAIAWSPYLDFSVNREANAKQWAAQDMRFDGTGSCASCHAPESSKLLAAPHQSIGCQSCHGPLLDHTTAATAAATSGSGVVLAAAVIATPTEEACLRCHQAVLGRPGTLKQIVTSQHYVTQCLECHDPHNSIANRPPVVQHPLDNLPACLTCHGADGFKSRNERHPSGTLTDQECLACHAAGRGPDAGSFKHTGFPLVGKHQGATCSACHADMSSLAAFKATPTECVACHKQVEPHNGSFGTVCSSCHSPDGWNQITFDHTTTAFPLVGKHTSAACSSCHTDTTSMAAMRATPTQCVACHKQVEPHNGAFGTSCADCHNPAGWSDVKIDHDKTGFALVGQHVGVACTACHKGGVFAGTSPTCSSCHERPTNHESNFGNSCASCHTPNGWQPAAFDHNARTPYKLSGAHLGAACVKCHANPATHAGAPTVCAGCHTKPAGHLAVSSNACQVCHATTAWKPATFNHSSAAFKLSGAHLKLECASCHKGGVYSGLPTACIGCHTKAGIHSPLYPATCTTCHSTTRWLTISYKGPHTFPKTHNGAAGRCTTCHTSNTVPYSCAKCHSDAWAKSKHAGVAGFSLTTCAKCHPTGNGD